MRQIRRQTVITLVLVVLCGFLAGQTAAQVPSNGFSLKHEVVINAPTSEVYRSMVQQIGEWWNPQHTYSGDSKNLSIDARPGGCFCETLPTGGVEHMRVVYFVPGEMLRLSGGLGPLQASGVAGSLSWKLTSSDSKATIVEVTYVVGGFMEGGFERVAPAVSKVIGEQLRRLKLFVETGRPSQETEQPSGA